MWCERCKCTCLNNSRKPAKALWSLQCDALIPSFASSRSLSLPLCAITDQPPHTHSPQLALCCQCAFRTGRSSETRWTIRRCCSIQQQQEAQKICLLPVWVLRLLRADNMLKRERKYTGKSLRNQQIRFADGTVCTSTPLSSAPRRLPLSLLGMIDMKSAALHPVYTGTCQK